MKHLSIKKLKKLIKMNNSINVTDKQLKVKLKVVCLICTTIKLIIKISRNSATQRFQKLKKLIHIDI